MGRWLKIDFWWFRPTVCEKCGVAMVSKKDGRHVSGRLDTKPPTLFLKFGRCYECGKRHVA